MAMDDAAMEYLAWLEERDWSELEPGQIVRYVGSEPELRGVWWVAMRRTDTPEWDLYYLRRPAKDGHAWEAMNAERYELSVAVARSRDY